MRLAKTLVVCTALATGCGSDDESPAKGGTGGSSSTGGVTSMSTSSVGGKATSGGSSGVALVGGTSPVSSGGSAQTGGQTAGTTVTPATTGGNAASGGTTLLATSSSAAAGGTTGTGGTLNTGGASLTGGASTTTGGSGSETGGTSSATGGSTGGTQPTGGHTSHSSTDATGGATGGASSEVGGTSTDTGGAQNAGGTSSTGTEENTGGIGTTSTDTGGAQNAGGTSSTGTEENTGGIGTTGGVASTGGTSGTGGVTSWSPPSGCGAIRESVVGWWSLDGTLDARSETGAPLVAISSAASISYTAGVGTGQALDAAAGSIVEVSDPALNATSGLTLSAFVKSEHPDGRILDRISIGGADGYLIDVYNGHLRMIVGDRWLESTATLDSLGGYTHVAGVFTGGNEPAIRLYVDGVLVDASNVAPGGVPSNDLTLRVGADREQGNVWSGQIDEPMVFARALGDDDVQALRNALLANACVVPQVQSPANGLLLEHDAQGGVLAGSLEHVHSNIRHVGDLRVLHEDALYTCDWNGMPYGAVVGCQVWAPFATETNTEGSVVPKLPLEWRLLRFNTSGLVDQLGVTIEAPSVTVHEQSHQRLSWLGRDWRTKTYAVDAGGSPTFGALGELAQRVRAGAGLGLHLIDTKYSLPHLTLLVGLNDDHFAALDPWHISAAAGTLPGEYTFQSSPYHYAVWFDTRGVSYAARWYLGSPNSISDSLGMEATRYFTEPGWAEVFALNAGGDTTTGSKRALLDAVLAGASVRVESAEGFYDCNVAAANAEVTCSSFDTYAPQDAGWAIVFDAYHTRRLRTFTSQGSISMQDWADHTATLLAQSEGAGALRWFLQPAGWALALQTDGAGNAVSGSVSSLVTSVRTGAEIAVAQLGSEFERVRCGSLHIDANAERVACVALVQKPGTDGGGATPGYYEARVYNTNGALASARVAFGSSDNSSIQVANIPWLGS